MKNIQQAMDNVEITYAELVTIANEMTKPHFEEIDKLIKSMDELQLHSLPNDILREFIIKLSMKAYGLSEIKDKSLLKQECAETLRKEKYAVAFNGATGTVGFKENCAQLDIGEELLVEAIYNLIASMFKTKLDEVHRMVDALKTVLMSRMQELKHLGVDATID